MGTVNGSAGDDALTGTTGDDTFEGGLGTDVVSYAGRLEDYRFGQADGYLIVTDINTTNGDDGTDRIRGVESLKFAGSVIPLLPGGETRINDETFDAQARPVVAQLDDGGQVVVWASWGQDGGTWGVFAQRFAADGSPSGAQFQVNTETADWQNQAAVAALTDGGFVVAWASYDQDGSNYGVYGQRYAADGTPVAAEFHVSTATDSDQEEPSVAALADGGFVICWQSYGQDGESSGVYGQRYNSTGTPAGGEFALNQYTASSQEGVSVAALPGGGFIAAWSSYEQDGDGDGVYARRYLANGDPDGDEFRVNTTTVGMQSEPAVAVRADGAIAVAWRSREGGLGDIVLQLFDPDGRLHGGEIAVNTTTADLQFEPSVAFVPGTGELVVGWSSYLQDGDSYGVYARVFALEAGDAVRSGAEFRVNTYTASAQYRPAVGGAGEDGFLVAWNSILQDGSDSGVYLQRFVPGEIVADAPAWPWSFALPELRGTALGDRFDLRGSGGDLAAAGAQGDDVYLVDSRGDRITERAAQGVDRIETGLQWSLAATPFIEELRLTGSADVQAGGNAAANRLWGNDGRNLLRGLAGNDTLDGGAGADTLQGDAGNDTYVVRDELDTIAERSNAGRDTLQSSLVATRLPKNVENLVLLGSSALDGYGNGLANAITGSAIANLLDGRAGADTLAGGRGDDIYRVDRAGDLVVEQIGEGTDTVVSRVSYTLAAHIEQLKLDGSAPLDGTGNFLANVLEGNGAANVLDGGTGADVLIGLGGDDTFYVDQSADTVIEAVGGGFDTVIASEAYTLPDNVERMRFTDPAGGTRGYSGTGNGSANLLEGAAGNDALNGLGGDDTLLGYAGDDTLAGGAGIDSMSGGAGDDLYAVDAAADAVIELPGEGTDRVESTVSYALPAAVEELRLLGSEDLSGEGNALDNLLDGNSGDNRLSGGDGDDTLDGGDAGVDTMEGGDGDDVYYVDDVSDQTVELDAPAALGPPGAHPAGSGSNIDTVISQVSYTLRSNIENLQLAGTANLQGTGNALDNLMSGNAGTNLLMGLGGVDIIDGGGGSDTLAGGLGRDTLAGGAAGDFFLFDAALAANVDTVVDFVHLADRIQLDEDVFTAFNAGEPVTAAQLRAGEGVTKASTADHRLIYNTTSGDLYYDADGTGAQAPVKFAVMGSAIHPLLTAADFVIVG